MLPSSSLFPLSPWCANYLSNEFCTQVSLLVCWILQWVPSSRSVRRPWHETDRCRRYHQVRREDRQGWRKRLVRYTPPDYYLLNYPAVTKSAEKAAKKKWTRCRIFFIISHPIWFFFFCSSHFGTHIATSLLSLSSQPVYDNLFTCPLTSLRRNKTLHVLQWNAWDGSVHTVNVSTFKPVFLKNLLPDRISNRSSNKRVLHLRSGQLLHPCLSQPSSQIPPAWKRKGT